LTDEALVRAHRAGTVGAAGVLLSRHRPSLERICRGRLRDRDAVEDAVQETLLACLKALPTFDGGELFGRYAKVVAVSVCRRAARQASGADLALDDEVADLVPPQDTSLEQRCLDGLLLQGILAELSPSDSALLLRHHGHDRPLAELAAEQGASLTAVKVRLHRARQRARVIAQRQGAFGLLPVPLLSPRLREALARLGVHRPEVLVGCALVAPVLVGVLPGVGPSPRGPAAPGSAAVVTLGAVDARDSASPVPPVGKAGRSTGAGAARAAGPAPTAGAAEAGGGDARRALDFAPVAVPLVQRTVAPAPPPGRADHSFEVADPAGGGALVGVDTYDEEHAGDACALVARVPALATCRAGAAARLRLGP
jgi:RNA polymerase sigma factor (sigma-70 family)